MIFFDKMLFTDRLTNARQKSDQESSFLHNIVIMRHPDVHGILRDFSVS